MPRASHKNTCKSDDIQVNENSKLKSEIYKCKDYMYREKRSAKFDRVLVSLKEHVFQKKTEHARNSIFLLAWSLHMFVVCFLCCFNATFYIASVLYFSTTHVRYNCFSDLTFSFYSLFINLNNECNVLMTVAIFVCTWTLKLSFQFSQTSNHHIHVFDFMIMLLSRIIIWLNVVLWLSKCINSDFESLNCTAFFSAHVKAIFPAFFSIFTFLSIFLLSMYSITLSI